MPFIAIQNPPKEMLDTLYEESKKNANQPCHDCGVMPGEKHTEGCDVARCQACGGQRLSCGCKECGDDIWEGLWPGTKECYEKGYVARWEGSNNPFSNGLTFDYNRLAVEHIRSKEWDALGVEND